MSGMLKNKKISIAIIIFVLLVLTGIIIGLVLKVNTGKKNDKEQDTIVYETDEDTVEEESENGLKESDSDDGPVLNENTMLDFNGGDAGDTDQTDEPKNEEDSKDTGSWGVFY